MLGTCSKQVAGPAEQEKREREEVEPFDGVRKPFVVAGKPPTATQPPEAPLHSPPPGKQHKSVLGIGQFHDLQGNPACFGVRRWDGTGVPWST